MHETWITKRIGERRHWFWDARMALQVNGISGDHVEFGSWGGNALSLAYEAIHAIGPRRHLWPFAWFQVLPMATGPSVVERADALRRA